jgi:hypothetical protein
MAALSDSTVMSDCSVLMASPGFDKNFNDRNVFEIANVWNVNLNGATGTSRSNSRNNGCGQPQRLLQLRRGRRSGSNC